MDDVVLFYAHLVYCTAIWNILWPVCIFCGQLVHFVAIWFFGGHLVYFIVSWYIFSRFWYVVSRKIWQPCPRAFSRIQFSATIMTFSRQTFPSQDFCTVTFSYTRRRGKILTKSNATPGGQCYIF
jgi:hypothetical protein